MPVLLVTLLSWFCTKQICDFPLILLFFLSITLCIMNAFINHFLTFTDSRDLLQIQGDSTGSVNILGSDNIGHCE